MVVIPRPLNFEQELCVSRLPFRFVCIDGRYCETGIGMEQAAIFEAR